MNDTPAPPTITVVNAHGFFSVTTETLNAVAQDFSGWTYDALLERVNGNAGFGLDYSDCTMVELLVILADMEGAERLALRRQEFHITAESEEAITDELLK